MVVTICYVFTLRLPALPRLQELAGAGKEGWLDTP